MADPIRRCLVAEEGTIRDAMLALDRGAVRIALAVDGSGRLVGVATDGDLRRALLGGATLGSAVAPHLTRDFVAVSGAEDRAAVLELMAARHLGAIPVVDEARRPVGLHLLDETIHAAPRPNQAVVMAGGLGVRLRPLTDNVPKPMLRVAGRPILERIVLHLVGSGIERVYLAIGYLGEVIEAHFGDGSAFGCRIEYLRESEPLGTAGALGLLPEPPTSATVVMNGDLVTQADLGGLLDLHERGGFVATIGIRRYLHTVPFGCVERVDERVQAIEEKPTLARDVNTGIYAIAPALVARVAPGRPLAMTDLIGEALGRGEPVGAFPIEDDWIDVGARDQLVRAREGG